MNSEACFGWVCVYGHRVATSENIAPRCKCGAEMHSCFYPPAGLEGEDRPKGSCVYCKHVPVLGERRTPHDDGCICEACEDKLGPTMAREWKRAQEGE